MTQTRLQSFIETNANTWLGFVGSFLITGACFKFLPAWFGVWWITMIATIGCTVWSLVRGYYVRRFFNALHSRQYEKEHAARVTADRQRAMSEEHW